MLPPDKTLRATDRRRKKKRRRQKLTESLRKTKLIFGNFLFDQLDWHIILINSALISPISGVGW